MHISRQRLLFGGIVILFLLVGCGYNAGNNASPTSQPPTGSVTLQVGATRYQVGSEVSVTIKNLSKQTISFADHQTNCTVLLLERQVADSWEPVASCKSMIMTRIHSLKAGASLEVKLTPSGQWPTGQYRATLNYRAGPNTAVGMSKTLFSSIFSVAS
jgi:hypothetical protein